MQFNGVPVKSTPPDTTGTFVLYPAPHGTHDLVVTADGRVTATMTGVPVVDTAYTYLNRTLSPIDPPAATMRRISGKRVATGASTIDALVRVLKTYTGGPTVEVASAPVVGLTGDFLYRLPAGPRRRPATSPVPTH